MMPAVMLNYDVIHAAGVSNIGAKVLVGNGIPVVKDKTVVTVMAPSTTFSLSLSSYKR